MAEYQCTHCDDSFEHQGPGPARCPRCLRRNGLLPAGEQASPARGERPSAGTRRPWLWLALGVSLLGLAIGAGLFFYKRATDLPLPGQLAQLDQQTLRLTLAARGVPADVEAIHPLLGGAGVAALVKEAGRETDGAKRALALATAVAGKISEAKPTLLEAPTWSARPPEALLKALAANPALEVTSLELASLLVAVLRGAGLPTVLAERFSSTAPVGAPDPSGLMGRYVAVVYPPGKLGAEPVARLDPYRAVTLPVWAREEGQAGMTVSADGIVPLGDASAAAHMMSQRALAAALKKPEQAYKLSRTALAAAAPSATLILARAQVLAAAGGTKDAVATARKALAAREDAPRQVGVARLLLMSGNADGALALLRKAIKQAPRFWPARQIIASVLGRVDADKAEEHLRAALEVAPEEPGLLLLDGTWHLSRGLTNQAAALLQKVAAARPKDLDVKLMLYHALVRSSQTQEAAAVRKELLEKAEKPEEMKELIETMNRAAAEAEAREEGEAGSSGAPETVPGPKLELPDVSLGK